MDSSTKPTLVKIDSAKAAPVRTVEMDNEQLEILRQSLCPQLNAAELKHFAMVCKQTALDPFRKQIFAFKDKQGRVNHITAVAGLRAIAARTGRRNGVQGPFWCGPDGQWRKVWLESFPPSAARYIVHVKGEDHPYEGIALWSFYGRNNDMWRRGGSHMLAKCAEALALRQAFPDELSGLYSEDEFGEDLDTFEAPALPKPKRTRKKAAKAEPAPEPEPEPEDQGPPPRPDGEPVVLWFGPHKGKPVDECPASLWTFLMGAYRGTNENAERLKAWARYLHWRAQNTERPKVVEAVPMHPDEPPLDVDLPDFED